MSSKMVDDRMQQQQLQQLLMMLPRGEQNEGDENEEQVEQKVELPSLDENEKQYREQTALFTRIQKDEEALKELEGKHVVILFGTTGTGKSTLANAMVNGVGNIELKDGLYNAVKPVPHNGEVCFKIGHTVKS